MKSAYPRLMEEMEVEDLMGMAVVSGHGKYIAVSHGDKWDSEGEDDDNEPQEVHVVEVLSLNCGSYRWMLGHAQPLHCLGSQ